MTSSTSDSPVAHHPLIKPSGCLGSGYIHITLGDITEWVFVSAYHDPDDSTTMTPAEVEKYFRTPWVQSLLARLAVTFEEFFSMTAVEWEADLNHAANPVTLLRLWSTAADVFDYYTHDKKLRRGAHADYLRLILRFFNNPGTCVDGIFNVLTPGRAMRVVAEMGRFFRQRPVNSRTVN